jgi:predicted  nucleic acid-binding Zn-ribbon protein
MSLNWDLLKKLNADVAARRKSGEKTFAISTDEAEYLLSAVQRVHDTNSQKVQEYDALLGHNAGLDERAKADAKTIEDLRAKVAELEAAADAAAAEVSAGAKGKGGKGKGAAGDGVS